MARIRSIKPEFFRDEKIAQIPKPTALFFVGLWTVADDQGIFSIDPRTLSLQLPIYRSQDVQKMLNALWQAGLVKCSPSDGVGLVTGWQHQKIDRPRDGKFKDKKIEWLTWSDDTKPREHSTQGSRIGKDRKGKDRILPEPPQDSDKLATSTFDIFGSGEPIRDEKTLGSEIWDSYANAIRTRYEITPIRNAKTSSQCKQLGERLGRDAIEVAAFFVAHPDAVLRRDQHPLGILLAKAETFHAQWQRREHTTFEDVKAQGDNYHERQLARLLAKPSVSL